VTFPDSPSPQGFLPPCGGKPLATEGIGKFTVFPPATGKKREGGGAGEGYQRTAMTILLMDKAPMTAQIAV